MDLQGDELLKALHQRREAGKLRAQIHPELDLTIWNYTREVQYNRAWDDVLLACRGLVTNSKGEVVLRPYEKFFNAAEPDAPRFESGDHFSAYEKLDGSLIIAGYYGREWVVASKGSFTSWHAEQARRLFSEEYPHFVRTAREGLTYTFELIHPDNKIVVDYGDDERLVLHGVRKTETGEDVRYPTYQVPTVDLLFSGQIGETTPEEMKANVPEGKEGYVLHTDKGKVKIKSEEYVRLHRVVSDLSERRVWEWLKDGEDLNELLDGVPDEYDEEIRGMAERLNAEQNAVAHRYYAKAGELSVGEPLESDEDRKQTALNYQECDLNTGALFQALLGNEGFEGWCWDQVKPEPKITHSA